MTVTLEQLGEALGGKKLCPRCCKGDRVCCEMFWTHCQECDSDGSVDGDWDDINQCYWGAESVPCHTCEGEGGWWWCDCDENGEHKNRSGDQGGTGGNPPQPETPESAGGLPREEGSP